MERKTQPRPNDLMATTGARLTSLMRQQGLSAAALAATLHIQRSTLENFRLGFRSIPSDVLDAMARELETNPDYLMERSNDPRRPPDRS